MRRVILQIEEKLRYRRDVAVMVPDDMDEKQLNSAIDKAQFNAESVDDLIHGLRNFGIEQNEPYDDSLNSPWDSEVECDDYKFVE